MRSVKDGAFENLFGLRVAHLLNKRTAQQNRYFLNGLLIGSELKNIGGNHSAEIVLVSTEFQKKYYSAALDLLNVGASRKWISSETATVNGHHTIFEKQFSQSV